MTAAAHHVDRKSASHGEAGYPRAAFDFYPTEPWVTRALCHAVEFDNRGILWEPACGDGRMAKELDKWHPAVVASDIVDHGYGETGRDFLAPETLAWLRNLRCGPIAAIVTNPPFGNLARRFIQRALNLTRESQGKVAILQRHEFDAPQTNHPLFEPPDPRMAAFENGRDYPDLYTRSLDAALELTHKLGFTSWTIEPNAAWVKWIDDGDLKQTYHVHFHGAGKATALALCIAVLKAWAARGEK